MEDPITTPCGHTFDRESLTTFYYYAGDKKACPVCRRRIKGYDPSRARTNYLVMGMIEEQKSGGEIGHDAEYVSIIDRLLAPFVYSTGFFT